MLHRLWVLLRAMLAAVGALTLLVTFTPLVPWAASRLSATWTDTDRGVLIVLAGGTVTYAGPGPNQTIGESGYWRAIHAIALWRHRHFQTVLVCGAYSGESIKPLLVANGIPASAILVEDRSTSTRENALFAKPILAGLPGPYVLLTSDYHTWRAKRCFAKENIPVETLPAPDLLKRSNTPLLRWGGFWELAGECVKIGYYRFQGWI
jgi:uncharacterized SAM-binding protein YcdF (DUF218 family)